MPIIDRCIKLKLGTPTCYQFTVVVINLAGSNLGMVVDSVSGVITLTAAQIKTPPQSGVALHTDYLIGLDAGRAHADLDRHRK